MDGIGDLVQVIPDTLKLHHIDRFILPHGFNLDFNKNCCFSEEADIMHSAMYQYTPQVTSRSWVSASRTDVKLNEISSVCDVKENDFLVCTYGGEWWLAQVIDVSRPVLAYHKQCFWKIMSKGLAYANYGLQKLFY